MIIWEITHLLFSNMLIFLYSFVGFLFVLVWLVLGFFRMQRVSQAAIIDERIAIKSCNCFTLQYITTLKATQKL